MKRVRVFDDDVLAGAWSPPNAPARALPPLPWRRLGAYTGAGIISGIANVALFHLARQAHLAPYLAWALAFEVGALVAFALHRHVTWRDRRVRTLLAMLSQLARAQAGNLAALLMNLAVFTALVHLGVPGDLDDAAGILAGFVLNFTLAHHYIYGPSRQREDWHRSGGA